MEVAHEDHPRGCGEHGFWFCSVVMQPGSSPRMRGALLTKSYYDMKNRIIPADAGST